MDKIQTKVLRLFILAIHSHLYNFALRFYFFKLTQPLVVSRVCTLQRRKEGKLMKNHTLRLKNQYKNLKFENSQDYAQKPQRISTFINSASGRIVKSNKELECACMLSH